MKTAIPIPAEEYSHLNLLKAYCKSSGLWGLYVSFHLQPEGPMTAEEIMKACPLLDFWGRNGQAFIDDCWYFLYKTEEEMNEAYYHVVGDDGPTKYNAYDGPARVYALTIGKDGQPLNENT